jgi:hypothetical protein
MPTKTELRAKLEALLREEGASFGSDALAGDIVDLIEGGTVLRLAPEHERPRLPRRVRLDDVDQTYLAAEFGPTAGLLEAPGDFFAHLDFDGVWNLSLEERRAIAREVCAAYNERQEIDEIEADVDNAISTGIEQLCREAVAAEVEKGVSGERARCLAIFDAFLSDLPEGWDFVRLRMREARGKVANLAWTGANDLPDHEPFEEDERLRDTLLRERKKAKGADPAREWPTRVSAILRTLYFVHEVTGASRPINAEEAQEAARRWEAEPRLREALYKRVSALQDRLLVALRDVGALLRILTGTES